MKDPDPKDRDLKDRLRPLAAALTAAFLLFVAFLANAGKMLVEDAPQPSDTILVLAGETDRRPALAMQLLEQRYARRVIIDVPAAQQVYGFPQVELAEKYIQTLPHAAAISLCPITGLSTKLESHEAGKCLDRFEGKGVLIVTSDFHTRRALSVFRREVHGKTFSVAGSHDTVQFGEHWWRHRQWAKTCLEEWMRLLWWSVVDRWR
jgi:DUF218 domain